MTEAAPKIPFMVRARLVTIGLVLGLVTGGVGAGYIWLDANNKLVAKDAEVEVAQKAADDAGAAFQDKEKALGARVALLDARVALARALDELDRRNFGTAQDLVTESAGRLAAAGQDDAAAKVKRTRLEVGEDVESSREVLHGLAREVDLLLQPAG